MQRTRIVELIVILLVCVTSLAQKPVALADSEKPNLIGTYLYTDRFEAAAKEQNRDLFDVFDEHFKKLADVGVNCIHITIPDGSLFDRYVQLAKKHKVKLLPEIDFAYFRPNWTDEQMAEHARKAVDFLKVWHATPEVIAWSVKEEPYTDEIEKLDRYYRMIIKGVPEVKFFLVTSGGGWLTANAADLPFALVGGDYYYFSWEQGPADKCFTRAPRFALSESRSTTEIYRRAAAKFPVDRIHVFGVAACTIPDRAQGFATGSTLPETWTPEQKQQYIQKVTSLAEKHQDGWAVYQNVPGKTGPQYTMWTLYMPPANCIRALIWGGILEGAKVTMAFSYSPYSKSYNPDSPIDAIINYPHRTERFSTDLGGRPDVKNVHFDEYAQTVKKVRSFDKIIPHLSIQAQSPIVGEPGFDIIARAFRMDGFDGQVMIVHNANVGSILCPDCKIAGQKSCEHVFIDDFGDLKYFTPQTSTNSATLKLNPELSKAAIYDVSTGKPLKRSTEGFVLDIGPGDAAILYVGNAADARRISQLYIPAQR
jgi:hypothetical protein